MCSPFSFSPHECCVQRTYLLSELTQHLPSAAPKYVPVLTRTNVQH